MNKIKIKNKEVKKLNKTIYFMKILVIKLFKLQLNISRG